MQKIVYKMEEKKEKEKDDTRQSRNDIKVKRNPSEHTTKMEK